MLNNEDESFQLVIYSIQFPASSSESAADCFPLGRKINQFWRLCFPPTSTPDSNKDFGSTFSTISSPNTEEESNKASNDLPVDAGLTADTDEKNDVFEKSFHAKKTDWAWVRQCKTMFWVMSMLPQPKKH